MNSTEIGRYPYDELIIAKSETDGIVRCMSNITHMASIRNDNRLISPEDTLEDVLVEIRDGKRVCNKLLVLTLNDEDGLYETGFYASNMRMSEMQALMARMGYVFNTWMDDK